MNKILLINIFRIVVVISVLLACMGLMALIILFVLNTLFSFNFAYGVKEIAAAALRDHTSCRADLGHYGWQG